MRVLLAPLLAAALPTLPSAVAELPAPGSSIERSFARGASVRHRTSLEAGQCLELSVSEGSLDLVVALRDGAGRRLALANNEYAGTERVVFIAGTAGEHWVEVGAARTVEGAAYRLSVVAVRDATAEDRARLSAQDALAAAWETAWPPPTRTPPYTKPAADLNALARPRFLEAAARWQAIGDLRAQAAAWHHLGVHTQASLGSREAREDLRRSLELSRQAGDRAREARLLVDVAETDQDLGDPQALEGYREALGLMRELGNENTGLVQNNLCVLLRDTGDFDEALAHCRATLELWKDGGQAEAYARMNNGALYASLGDGDAALGHYRDSLPLFRRAGNRYMEAIALSRLGGAVLRFDGDAGAALAHLMRAQALTVETGSDGQPAVLVALAQVHRARGELAPAAALLERASAAWRASGEVVREASVLLQLADVSAAQGDSEAARARFTAALGVFRRNGYRPGEAAALRGLAQLARNHGDLREARDRIEEALQVLETLRGGLPHPGLRQSYLASFQEYYELHTDVLMRLDAREPGAGHAAQAFAASERGRARTLVELLREARVDLRSGVEPSLLSRERRLRRLVALKTERALRTGRAEAEQGMRKELDELLLQQREVQAQIRRASPGRAAMTEPEPLGVAELVSLLRADELLLEFSLGAERSYLWAATSNGVQAFSLPARAEIEALARRLHEQWSAGGARGPTREARATAERLSERLLGPVSGMLERRRLIVVADGALAYVPFAALPKPGTRGRRLLIEDHELVGLPSLSVLPELRRLSAARPAAARLAAILADPVFAGDDPRLSRGPHAAAKPRAADGNLARSARDFGGAGALQRLAFTRQEAEAIRALAPSDRTLAALDFDASRKLALDGSLGDYRIVHLASHGLINGRHPELSAVVLSMIDSRGEPQDGLLRLQDVYNMKLTATDLVVLSACRTALGKEIRGEGLVGLTRGFMHAGASRVLASLWDVRDRATAELMRRFYAGVLQRGERPAAALRAAQLSMLEDPRWSAPHYWAAFVLQGEWR